MLRFLYISNQFLLGDGTKKICFTYLLVILSYIQYLRPCTNNYLVLINIGDVYTHTYKAASTVGSPRDCGGGILVAKSCRDWGHENLNMKMDLTTQFSQSTTVQSWTNIKFETCKAFFSRM